MIDSIRDLKQLAKTDPAYKQIAIEVSIDLGGPAQPYEECLQYIIATALEVGEDTVVDEINHSIKLKR